MAHEFIAKYPPQSPKLNLRQNTKEQLEELDNSSGVSELGNAPASGIKPTVPPEFEKSLQEQSLYLWVILPDAPRVVYANEKDPKALCSTRQRICHTNLTGGRPASGGGEMWFEDNSTILMNGLSGRYPIKSAVALADAALVFARKGYRTGHMGMSKGTGKPRRSARKADIVWFEPVRA